jgi:hypothetical protein
MHMKTRIYNLATRHASISRRLKEKKTIKKRKKKTSPRGLVSSFSSHVVATYQDVPSSLEQPQESCQALTGACIVREAYSFRLRITPCSCNLILQNVIYVHTYQQDVRKYYVKQKLWNDVQESVVISSKSGKECLYWIIDIVILSHCIWVKKRKQEKKIETQQS